MKFAQILTIILLMVFIAFLSNACSKGKSPVEPVIDNSSEMPQDIPDTFGTEIDQRKVLSVYECVIDPVAKTFTAEPINRSANYHYPLTQLYPNVLQITGYGWTPNFWADIKLVHPLTGSGIDAFDPRVIAILPANAGVSMNYPIFDIQANNSVVLEPDGYTKLFDSINPSIIGNANPFMAYMKDEPYRVWSSTGTTDETKRWQMNISGFGGPLQFKLVVDVSTNYPNPPTPITDNASEPIEIDADIGDGLTNQGGMELVWARLKHWKYHSQIGGVVMEAPDLLSDTMPLYYYSYSPYYGASIFKGTLTNDKLAPAGNYSLLIKSWDWQSGIAMFNEFNVSVRQLLDGGNLIWAKRAGGVSSDWGTAIITLSDNSIVITGGFKGTSTFGPGEFNETNLISDGDADVFIARYNLDGKLVWAKRAGGPGIDSGIAITALSDNSTVITGGFSESITFGPGELNETTLISDGGREIFIARYNSNGTLAWAKGAGAIGDNTINVRAITTVSDSSTVVTGYFKDVVIFGPGEVNETILTTSYGEAMFIAKYNSDGTIAWARSVGDPGDAIGSGITTLADNSTVITGNFVTSSTFGQGESNETILHSAGNEDIFIARYNFDGTLAWAKSAGGIYGDYGDSNTTLDDDSTVVTGRFHISATFGEGEINETMLNHIGSGGQNIFIARYNPDGTLTWAKQAGGTSYPYENDESSSITTLSDNSTVITGSFYYDITFGPDEIYETTFTSSGNSDIFIARYYPDGTLAWAKQASGISAESGEGITTLSDDTTVITGAFYESDTTFGQGEPNETILTSDGLWDIFIARFEP